MLIIPLIFVFYAALFIFLYNYTQSYQLQKLFAGRRPVNTVSFLADVLIPLGMPWFFLVTAGTYWGFTIPPGYVSKFRLEQGDGMSFWLLIAILLGFGFSYTVIFQGGLFVGYRNGRSEAFPQFIRETADGKPFEIRGFVRTGQHRYRRGGELSYHDRLFTITTLVEGKDDCSFVIARYEPEAEE